MTPRYASIIRDSRHRAPADALLLAAMLALALAPLPGLLIGAPAAPSTLVALLLPAVPIFALPPFLVGGGVGTLLHLTVTAHERAAAFRAGCRVTVSAPSLVGTSLFVAAVFGSIGFAVAAMLSQLH